MHPWPSLGLQSKHPSTTAYLLILPREIRDLIYHYFFRSFDNRIPITTPDEYNGRAVLFRLNRQINREADDIFYRDYYPSLYFYFTGPILWITFMQSVGRHHQDYCGQLATVSDNEIDHLCRAGSGLISGFRHGWTESHVEYFLQVIRMKLRCEDVSVLEGLLLHECVSQQFDSFYLLGKPQYIFGPSWKIMVQYSKARAPWSPIPSMIRFVGEIGKFFAALNEGILKHNLDEGEDFPFVFSDSWAIVSF